MIYTQPIDYPGFDSIEQNIQYYIDKFFTDSIIVFRNANLTQTEHEELMKMLGDNFNWFPNSTALNVDKYHEDHSRAPELKKCGSDDLILDWHIEHVLRNNSIIASSWNMHHFTTSPENGKTYFLDTSKVYALLTQEEQDFLFKSKIGAIDRVSESMVSRRVIAKHWKNDEYVIRIPMHEIKANDFSFTEYDRRVPTQSESEVFHNIINKIVNEINNNKDIRIVHKWNQGDLVIPDLFKLAHAVTGGFASEERSFTGIWGFERDYNI